MFQNCCDRIDWDDDDDGDNESETLRRRKAQRKPPKVISSSDPSSAWTACDRLLAPLELTSARWQTLCAIIRAERPQPVA